MKKKKPRLFIQLAVAILTNLAHGEDWPQWRGPRRDGKSEDTGLLKVWPEQGPKLLWKTSEIGSGFASAVTWQGMVYITGGKDGKLTIFAFDDQGGLKWRKDHDNIWAKNFKGSRGTPTIDDGKLYVESCYGLVGCYDARSGRKVWSNKLSDMGGKYHNWGYSESVLIAGKAAVVTPGGSVMLAALDKNNGKSMWSVSGDGGEAHYCSAIYITYNNVPMIIQGTGSGIVGVHAEHGRKLWFDDFCAGNTANCCTPAFSDGYVFWSNGYGKGGVCLKLTVRGSSVSASRAWTTRDLISHHGGYIIHEGHIYGNHNNGWTCLELETGRKKWFDQGVGKGSISFADGMLYTFSESGGRIGLVKATPNSFQQTSGFSVHGRKQSWAHPTIANGRLYLRYAENLYCYDVRGPNYGRSADSGTRDAEPVPAHLQSKIGVFRGKVQLRAKTYVTGIKFQIEHGALKGYMVIDSGNDIQTNIQLAYQGPSADGKTELFGWNSKKNTGKMKLSLTPTAISGSWGKGESDSDLGALSARKVK